MTASIIFAPGVSSKQESSKQGHIDLFPVGSGLSLAGVLLFFLPKRCRFAGLLLVLVFAALGTMAGCGSGGTPSSSGPAPGVPSGCASGGTYNVTVIPTGGATIQTASITLTVH